MITLKSIVRIPYWNDDQNPAGYVEGLVVEIRDNKFTVMISRNAAFEYTEEELMKWMKEYN